MNLMSTWHCAHLSPPHCAITQSGINFVLDVLGGFLNASDYAKEMYAAGRWYAYGWDQSPWQAWPAVKSLYSAVKEKFPLLSTAAVLESAPNGLPACHLFSTHANSLACVQLGQRRLRCRLPGQGRRRALPELAERVSRVSA